MHGLRKKFMVRNRRPSNGNLGAIIYGSILKNVWYLWFVNLYQALSAQF